MIYVTPPLPFQGNKRYFVKQFKEVIADLPEDTVFVDLFGGSGLLSRAAKDVHPDSRMIYNDFDGFVDRLRMIPKTNKILEEIRPLVAGFSQKEKLPAPIKAEVLKIIARNEPADYITLSQNLLFSGRYATSFDDLKREVFYNKVRKTPIDASGYLDGLEIRHADYCELFEEFRYDGNVIFLIDPPYLSTDSKSYSLHWELSDYLDVLALTVASRYIFFTSNKSSLIDLVKFLIDNYEINILRGEIYERENQINFLSRYTDIMIVNKSL